MATNGQALAAKRKMGRENFLLPDAIRQAMEALAEKRSVTKAEILRTALREYFERQPELKEVA
ncbi:CopG family transcriptional regulator [Paraburkholderia sp. BCC1884]|uniref:ribbon-helix-helix domain-containing protein n=1 Tax=Paraburkholderia sp. BCC1884 TaxID=2562668 RepID=UPI0011829FA4|nr:CopG family transcriptional regulator [Paraburkholderia sp. BCC1884]